MKTAAFICFAVLSTCALCGFSQSSGKGITISHLTGNFYVYVTWKNLDDGTPYPSNSMYLVTKKGVVMFDTPWDSTQFQPLLDSIEARHHQKVVLCISTHFHADRTAGLDFLRKHGVKTYSSLQTYLLCAQRGEKQAEHYFTKDTTFSVGGEQFLAYYPGKGHTADNIVIWFAKQKILYGGCLVKSTETGSLGNLADADVTAWPATMQNLLAKFPDAAYVIPGHLSWQGNQHVVHTLQLLKQNGQ